MLLRYTNKKNFKLISKYNINFIKKFFSAKLLCNNIHLFNKEIYSYNLNFYLNQKKKKTIIKNLYVRKEVVPVRVLRYFLYFNEAVLNSTNVIMWLTTKFMIYNGKKLKPINIYRGNLENILKCKFKFGDFVFTRIFHFFKKKK